MMFPIDAPEDDEEELRRRQMMMGSPYSGSAELEGATAPGAPRTQALDPTMEIAKLRLAQAPWAQRERALKRQMGIADELRGTKAPGMRTAGRVVVASNPLESLGALGKVAAGEYRNAQLENQDKAMIQSRMKSLGATAEDIERMKREEEEYGGGRGFWGR
jgi:hypothetical protein